jgi:nucleoside-diphosphate-sugar epimerase
VVETGALDIERDYFPVADAASALVGLAINPRAPGLIVNVCTGRATPLRALAEGLASACGKPVRFRVNGSPSPGNARNYGSPGRLEALGLRMPTRSVAELIASLRHRDV